jgi:hypothetical protein
VAARQLTSCVLYLHLAVAAIGVRAAQAGSWQQAAVPNAPDLDAGFRLLYELKPAGVGGTA